MVACWSPFTTTMERHGNDEDNSDSYKGGVECWIRNNHANHGNDDNHGNPGWKPGVPQTMGLEMPEIWDHQKKICSDFLLFSDLFRFACPVFLRNARGWPVLNGVGADEVGVNFPLFYAVFPFFYAFLRFSSLFSSSPEGQGQTTAMYYKNGEFHSDPVCTAPVQNFPKRGCISPRPPGGCKNIILGDPLG